METELVLFAISILSLPYSEDAQYLSVINHTFRTGEKKETQSVNCFSLLGSVRGERNQVLKEDRVAVWWRKEGEFGAWEIEEETSKPMAIQVLEYVTICEKGHRLALMKARWGPQKVWCLTCSAVGERPNLGGRKMLNSFFF